MEEKGVENMPHQHKRPTLRITIPTQQPVATSSNNPIQKTSSNTAAATKVTTASNSHCPPPQQVSPEQDPPGQDAVLFTEVDYSRGKIDPASSISSHSPLSDTLGRVAYTSPPRATKKHILESQQGQEQAQVRDIGSVETGAEGGTQGVNEEGKTEGAE
ncbi:MAG: hypothetical protein Q9209_002349 [Squamulea sp. 1 TL-2023]